MILSNINYKIFYMKITKIKSLSNYVNPLTGGVSSVSNSIITSITVNYMLEYSEKIGIWILPNFYKTVLLSIIIFIFFLSYAKTSVKCKKNKVSLK